MVVAVTLVVKVTEWPLCIVDISFLSFLISRRFVSILLGTFILLLILGTLFPQEMSSSLFEVNIWRNNHPLLAKIAQLLGGSRLFTSAPFLVISGLLLFSTAICTFQRIGSLREGQFAIIDANYSLVLLPGFLEKDQVEVVSSVCHYFRKHGYSAKEVPGSKEMMVAVRKGNVGRWGSVMFHLSLLILLIGALVSVWTRSEGSFILTEGQSFHGAPTEYMSRKPAVLPWNGVGDFEVVLQQFVPEFGQPPTYASKLVLRKAGEIIDSLDVRTFQAGSYAGRTFYQKEHGFSQRFHVETTEGETLFDGFVALASHFSEDKVRYENIFYVVEKGLKIEGELFPDAVQQEGVWSSLSPLPKRPVVLIRIEQEGIPVFDGPIPLDKPLKLKDFNISFTELRYWSGIQLVTDLGVPILYTGFFLGCLGLMIRTFFVEQGLWVKQATTAEGTSLVLCGATERDQALFAEKFEKLADELRTELRRLKGETGGE